MYLLEKYLGLGGFLLHEEGNTQKSILWVQLLSMQNIAEDISVEHHLLSLGLIIYVCVWDFGGIFWWFIFPPRNI